VSLTVAITGMNAGESPQPGPAIARSLRGEPAFEAEGGRIVGLLYDAMESGIFFEGLVDHAFLIPYPSSGLEPLFHRIREIHAQTPIDVLVATLDAEMPAFIRLESRLKELGIRMYLPTDDHFQCRSKARLEDFCGRIGIRCPRQALVTDLSLLPGIFNSFGTEVVVKGVFYDAGSAASAVDAAKIASKIAAKWGLPIILQQKVAGDEYCLALFGDGTGAAIGAVGMRKMALTEKGKAFSGMTVNDPDLYEIGRRFVEKTKWRGALELEMVRSRADGAYYLFEINPRFPAWIYLASHVGQNLPWASVQMAREEAVTSFPPCRAGQFFVRHSIDIVSDITRLEQLAVHGEIHA
jgi:carbamoyl-phosphate synthase large subunit